MSLTVRITRGTGSFSSSSRCDSSMRLASKVSGTTSVAPAACNCSSLVSSWVRTRIGTSPRRSRTARRMRSATSGLAKVITTQLRAGDADILQHLDLSRVAVDDRVARLSAGADAISVQVERNVLEAGLLEHARNVLADPAETADDHVIALRDGERRLRLAHRFAVAAGRIR